MDIWLNTIEPYRWVIALLLGFLVLLLLIIRSVYQRLRTQEQRFEALVNVLRNEIQVMGNSSIGMGKRVLDVEKRLNITSEKQQELENRDPGLVAYNQASRLMEVGATVDDLVKTCGIGRPEAELMALLHRELGAAPNTNRKIGREH